MKTDSTLNELLEILVGIIQFGLIALVLMLLWNWLMPALFALPVLTYWQACGLRALVRFFIASRPDRKQITQYRYDIHRKTKKQNDGQEF